MRAGVFDRLYARAWEETCIVVAACGNDVGWCVVNVLIGSGDAMGGLRAGTVGMGVVGEMSTCHNHAPKGSCKPWRMVLPSLSRTRSWF